MKFTYLVTFAVVALAANANVQKQGDRIKNKVTSLANNAKGKVEGLVATYGLEDLWAQYEKQAVDFQKKVQKKVKANKETNKIANKAQRQANRRINELKRKGAQRRNQAEKQFGDAKKTVEGAVAKNKNKKLSAVRTQGVIAARQGIKGIKNDKVRAEVSRLFETIKEEGDKRIPNKLKGKSLEELAKQAMKLGLAEANKFSRKHRLEAKANRQLAKGKKNVNKYITKDQVENAKAEALKAKAKAEAYKEQAQKYQQEFSA